MLTLEELEAQIASLREELTQTQQIASRHGDEHTGEGLDPYSPHARNTQLPVIGEPTYDDVEDANTLFHSTGWFSGGAVSDVGSENVTIAAGTGVLRSAASATTQLLFFDWPELATQAITTDAIRYVGVEYNNGTPQATIRTTDNFDHFTDFELAIVVNEGGTLHIQQHEHHAGDTSHTTIERFHQTMHIERDNQGGGLILSDSADSNNDIAVTAGAVWIALDRFAISAIDTSGASTFDGYSSQGKEDTGIGAWPNTLYDNGSGGTGTLQTIGNNKWANLWWYIETDGHLVMVYGSNHYVTEAQAEGEALPTTLPNRIQVHGLFIGRFIFQKGEDASQVLTAFTETFTVAGVTGHGDLAGVTADQHHLRAQIIDDDGDTQVQVEEAADEDVIRFDTGGSERAKIDGTIMTLNDVLEFLTDGAPSNPGTGAMRIRVITDGANLILRAYGPTGATDDIATVANTAAGPNTLIRNWIG